MIIGIPKEIMHDEARVAATPDSVKKYVADGHRYWWKKVPVWVRSMPILPMQLPVPSCATPPSRSTMKPN